MITLYGYSLLWLSEGQPQNNGDPLLNALAWVCVGAALLELLAFFYVIARIYRTPSTIVEKGQFKQPGGNE